MRCLVLADGFDEWQKVAGGRGRGSGSKMADVFTFAGL
jgi:putative SOS response-associated peptidase YedK